MRLAEILYDSQFSRGKVGGLFFSCVHFSHDLQHLHLTKVLCMHDLVFLCFITRVVRTFRTIAKLIDITKKNSPQSVQRL